MGVPERLFTNGIGALHSAGLLETLMRRYPFQKSLTNDLRVHAWKLLGAHIEEGVYVGPWLRMRAPRNVTIRTGTSILGKVWIDSWDTVTIGRNVLINDEVSLLTGSHDVNSPTFAGDVGAIAIGDYAWLPTHIIVLPGVSIGEAAVVGTGSVVSRDVEAYSIVAGNPATVVSHRARQQYTYVPSQL